MSIGATLAKVCWSPDGKLLLFGTSKGEILVHDAAGNASGCMDVACVRDVSGDTPLAGLDW